MNAETPTLARYAEHVKTVPVGIVSMTEDRASIVCRCGRKYVPQIARLTGQTRIITRVRPCPKCNQPRESRYDARALYPIKSVLPVRQYVSVMDVPTVPVRRMK